MSDLVIKTNNVPRQLLSWHELSEKERAEFDYLDTEEAQEWARFVRYKNWVYHTGDIMRIDVNRELLPSGFENWHGYISDSFFSGVLFRISDDNESVICATYYS